MKILFGILLAAGIAAVGAGLGPLSDHDRLLGLAVAGAGIAMIAAICLWVPGFMNRREKAQEEADTQRAHQLAERIAQTSESFNVGSVTGVLLLSILLTATGALILTAALQAPTAMTIFFAGLFALGAFLAWTSAIPRLNAPALSLSSSGVRTALYGFIPWRDIGALNLQVQRARSSTIRFLEFQVPALETLRPQMHWCGRVWRALAFGPMREVLRFPVSRADAVVAYQLALSLWQRDTGRQNFWIPAGAGDLGEELRREHDLLERLNQPDMLNDPEKALALMKEHEAKRAARRH